MYSDWVLLTLLGAVFIWLGFLSFLVWKEFNFLNSLFPKSGERDVRKKFEEVLEETLKYRKDLEAIKEELSKLEEDGLKHVQRIELLRYNPFEDTGGNISFSLALLDDLGNGFVVTSLHSRADTRIFAKPVTGGKGEKYQLSNEEEEVVRKAMSK